MERVDFNGTDISGVLDRLPDAERNRLPFGVVKLDPNGTILAYNMAEAEISGVRVEDVIGKNFFLDVAVCTQRPEFYGRFRDAMDNDRVLNLIFDYEFQNALYAAVHEPIKVRVHMFSSYEIGGKKIVWLMVKRVGGNRPRTVVQDVAAQAAAQLGVPVLGSAEPQRHSQAPWLTMPSVPPPLPPLPTFAPATPVVPMPPYLSPAQPQYGQAQFAPMQPPMNAPMQPPMPPARAADTQGVDIVIRFDDI